MYENFLLAIIGIGILFIYTQEKEKDYKFIWLFSGLLLVFASFLTNIQVSKTTDQVNFTNSGGVTTGNTITTYTYADQPNLTSIGLAFGLTVVSGVALYYFYRLWQALYKSRP